jgi:hypothetical protein
MTQDDTITPFIDLVKQWSDDWHKAKDNDFDLVLYVALQATRWGADQELEACCEWLVSEGWFKYEHEAVEDLRAARRPKPPSLKEQALMHFQSFAATFETSGGDSDLIRRALEALPDCEG